MEDIIEEVMGDIDDEYDDEEPEIQKISDDTYVMDGSMDLDDIDEELGINLESDNSETIGGFIIDMLGEIPDEKDVGKEIEAENCKFRIDSIRDRRIEQITLTILPKTIEMNAGEAEIEESADQEKTPEKPKSKPKRSGQE